MEEPGRLQSMGSQRLRHGGQHTHAYTPLTSHTRIYTPNFTVMGQPPHMASSVARFIALIWVVLNPVFQVFQERDRQKSVSVACDLFIIFIFTSFFGCAGSQLWHQESSLYHSGSLSFGLFVVACDIQFLVQILNLGPLRWEHGVLPTGPPGKSLLVVYNLFLCVQFTILTDTPNKTTMKLIKQKG